MSSDVSWHIRDKLRPMPKHGSIKLYTSTETRRLVRTDSPARPPWLAHSSWTMNFSFFSPTSEELTDSVVKHRGNMMASHNSVHWGQQDRHTQFILGSLLFFKLMFTLITKKKGWCFKISLVLTYSLGASLPSLTQSHCTLKLVAGGKSVKQSHSHI